ncbi:MAG: rhodanese-like domain-containing protein [Planctomycetota bacterium]|jgi:rhodanese-related sulfurtransferase
MGWTGIIVLGVLAAIAVLMLYRSRRGGRDISQEQLLEWMGRASDCCILDVRSADEYNSGHIHGAINIGHKEISARLAELKPHEDKNIVVYCERGVRARMAQNTLARAGFASVYHLTGDMAAWRGAGRPADTAGTEPNE